VIIRPDGDSLLFITQPDHAQLAAHAIEHWQEDGFPVHPSRDDILFAAREHDNGWIEEDSSTHVGASGAPLDFVSVPVEVKHRIWPRAAARIAGRSPYAAALIAQHALAVYSSTRTDPAWQGFFDEMTRIRDTYMARTQTDLETLARDYLFVNAADRISLAFCTGWQQPLHSHGRQIILADRNTVEISPDPFSGARVPLRVPARRLSQRRFDTSAALKRALDAAPVDVLEGTAVGTA
jgi:hypothetical protein